MAKWINQFGSLNDLVDRVDEVKGKAGDALRENLAGVMMNRQLTELVRDVPLGVLPDELAAKPWDRDAVHRLFDELEFRVLRDRLFGELTTAEPEAEHGFEVSGGALEPGELPGWLDQARAGRHAGRPVVPRRVDRCRRRGGRAAVARDRAGRRHGRVRRRHHAQRGGREGTGGLARRPGGGQARLRRQAVAARDPASRLDAAGARDRHPAGRVPGAAGPALVRAGRPRAALPQAGAAGRAAARGAPAVAFGR